MTVTIRHAVRLTANTRKTIVDKALAKAFSAEEQTLRKEGRRLARTVYDDIVPAADLRRARRLPKHWLTQSTIFHANVAGRTLRLELAEPLPMPQHSEDGCYGRLGTIAAGALADRVDAHFAALTDLKARREKAGADLSALLDRVTTLKALGKCWPAGADFYKDLDRPAAALPAPLVADINHALGLAA